MGGWVDGRRRLPSTHPDPLFRVIARAFALVAVSAMAAAARRNLDALQLAHVVSGVVLAAFHLAENALILVGKGHIIHLPFLDTLSMPMCKKNIRALDGGW